jgi:hypothetical protein
MKTRIPRIAGAVLAGSLTLGVAAPAMAQDAPAQETARHGDLDSLKAKCNEAIERRLRDLGAATERLDNAEVLTEAHEATLDGIIDGSTGALTALHADISAADNLAMTLRLCPTIASAHRMYVVVLPQAHLTLGADRSAAAVNIGEGVVDRFDEAVEKAIEAGADVTEAVALMDQAEAHLAAADDADDGVADSVLAVTPASWNDGPGQAALEAARASLRSAHSELKAANEHARAALRALRDAVDDVPTTP